MFTITAAFEYQLISDDKYVDRITGEKCEKSDLMVREVNGSVSGIDRMADEFTGEYLQR